MVNKYVKRLLKATLHIETSRGQIPFYILTLSPALIFPGLLIGKISIIVIGLLTIVVMNMPLLVLLAKLERERIKNSKEGEKLISELLDNYKINYYNMREAIEVTAINMDLPNSKMLLFDLSRSVNLAVSNDDIKEALEYFKYSFGTLWANILADNMYFALTSGIKVEAALNDLAKTLENARKVNEFERRENNESRIILKVLFPVCYALTVFCAIGIFGMSFDKFLEYQFTTEEGLTWMIVAVILYITAVFTEKILSRSKLDI